MNKPYYESGGITIYHGDCLDILPTLEPVDLVLTDPPYGVSKRPRTYHGFTGAAEKWDSKWNLSWATLVTADTIALMPGIGNLPRCPEALGGLPYVWTLAIHVSNGMTRSPVGYGNWIPCVLYSHRSLYRQESDVARISISGRKGKHPTPKPYAAMRWLVDRLPGNILDPFMGSGTTLLAAKNRGRKAIGIEIEEKWCEEAVQRLSQEVLL